MASNPRKEEDQTLATPGTDGIEFSQRLYSIDELRQSYASVGTELLSVYHAAAGRGSRSRGSSRSSSRLGRSSNQTTQ
jgi:hypothetical protein